MGKGTALTPLRDAANFNSRFGWENTSGLYDVEADYVGQQLRGNYVFGLSGDWDSTRTGVQNVQTQLDSGISLSFSGTIQFAFADSAHSTGAYNNPFYGLTEGQGYTSFTTAQRIAARQAIQNWDELIAPTFEEVNGAGGADIVFANTTTGPAQAWAYYPISGGSDGRQFAHLGSDVWIATPEVNGSNGQLRDGQYGLQTLNHELGHTLGLSHPGEYDFGDDLDGDGQPDPITYTGDAQYFQDSNQFSIMSYFDTFETGAQNIDWNVMRFVYPSTPMVHDVFVAQQKYGADMTTRTADSTYGFNASGDVTNSAMRFTNGEMFTIFTIWDAGGTDTINLSGYYTPSVIDLREGAYSSAGGYGAYNPNLVGTAPTLQQINANNKAAGFTDRSGTLFDIYFKGVRGTNEGLSWKEITGTDSQLLMQQNIGIAYDAVIENAVGGFGNDRINGNQADNRFTGNAGADVFVIADYSGTQLDGDVIVDNSIDTITDFSRSQGDRIDLSELGVSFGNLSFNNASDTVTVNLGNDTVQFVILGASSIQSSDFVF